MGRELTPDFTMKLPEGGIFVFGSNAGGFHGAGGAKFARTYFGAIYGQPRGIQGKSYAIVTKKDWRTPRSSSLAEIGEEINTLYTFAGDNPHLKFYMTRIGMNLAGYTAAEMKHLFVAFGDRTPDNIILPKEYEFRD